MALMSITKYRLTTFAPGSRPSINTIKAWIESGALYGEQPGGIGSKWYVDPDHALLPAPVHAKKSNLSPEIEAMVSKMLDS